MEGALAMLASLGLALDDGLRAEALALYVSVAIF